MKHNVIELSKRGVSLSGVEDVKEAVDELNLVLSGKLEARNADDLLNEL